MATKMPDIHLSGEVMTASAIQVVRHMENLQEYVFQLIRSDLEECGAEDLQAFPADHCIDTAILLDPSLSPYSMRYVVTSTKVYHMFWLVDGIKEEDMVKVMKFAQRIIVELNLKGRIDVYQQQGIAGYMVEEDLLRYVIFPELISTYRREFLIGCHGLLWAFIQLAHPEANEDEITGKLGEYIKSQFRSGKKTTETEAGPAEETYKGNAQKIC